MQIRQNFCQFFQIRYEFCQFFFSPRIRYEFCQFFQICEFSRIRYNFCQFSRTRQNFCEVFPDSVESLSVFANSVELCRFYMDGPSGFRLKLPQGIRSIFNWSLTCYPRSFQHEHPLRRSPLTPRHATCWTNVKKDYSGVAAWRRTRGHSEQQALSRRTRKTQLQHEKYRPSCLPKPLWWVQVQALPRQIRPKLR